MLDITKCEGKDCPIKDTCYRFVAKADPYRQEYSQYEYSNGECDYFFEYTK